MKWLGVMSVWGLASCAPIGLGPPHTLDAPLSTRIGEVPYGVGTVAVLEQRGTRVHVQAHRRCKLVEQTVVRRTVTRERVNEAPALDWALAGTGAALAVGGVVVLVDSGAVHESNLNSQTYNPVGPSNARIIGGSLLVAGLGLATIALVDQARASGFVQHTEAVGVDGKTTNDRVPCSQSLIAEADVALALEATEPTFVGRTNKDGALTFEPDAFVPVDTALSEEGTFTLLVDEAPVGELSQAPLLAQREARAFSGLDAKGCSEPTTADGCVPVEQFLEHYPKGAHAPAAREMMKTGEPKLLLLRDAAAWARVAPELPRCTAAKTLAALEAACKPLREYAAAFPNGVGREATQKALGSVAPKRLALEKQHVRCTAACLKACERGPEPATCAALCDTRCTE